MRQAMSQHSAAQNRTAQHSTAAPTIRPSLGTTSSTRPTRSASCGASMAPDSASLSAAAVPTTRAARAACGIDGKGVPFFPRGLICRKARPSKHASNCCSSGPLPDLWAVQLLAIKRFQCGWPSEPRQQQGGGSSASAPTCHGLGQRDANRHLVQACWVGGQRVRTQSGWLSPTQQV